LGRPKADVGLEDAFVFEIGIRFLAILVDLQSGRPTKMWPLTRVDIRIVCGGILSATGENSTRTSTTSSWTM